MNTQQIHLAVDADAVGQEHGRAVAPRRGLGARPAPVLRRMALNKRDAAAVLGVSVDSFERHVQPELRYVRRGKLRLFAISELERWLDLNAARALD